MHEPAEWTEQSQDARGACEMYMKVGNYEKALELIETNRWPDVLSDLASQIGDEQREILNKCAQLSHKFENTELAEILLRRLNDLESLVEVSNCLLKDFSSCWE